MSLVSAEQQCRLVCLQAFLAASLKTDAELLKWFRDRLVWNEPETVVDLLKNGLFVRLYEPQVWWFPIHRFVRQACVAGFCM